MVSQPVKENVPRIERLGSSSFTDKVGCNFRSSVSGNVFLMGVNQNVMCDKHRIDGCRSSFSNPVLKEIEERILLRVKDGYLPFSDLIPLIDVSGPRSVNRDRSAAPQVERKFRFLDVLFVYRTLELRRVINNNIRTSDCTQLCKYEGAYLWTKLEMLRLLHGIELFGDNWVKVGEFVGRSKSECILKFLKMDFEMNVLKHKNERMVQTVFVLSRVHPSVASVLAGEILKGFNDGGKVDWEPVIERAKKQIELEKKKIKRLREVAYESELLKLRLKLKDFRDMVESVKKEKVEIEERINMIIQDITETGNLIEKIKG